MDKKLSNGQILFGGKPVSVNIQKDLKLAPVKKLRRRERRKMVKALTRDCNFSFTYEVTPELRRQLQELKNDEDIKRRERLMAYLITKHVTIV